MARWAKSVQGSMRAGDLGAETGRRRGAGDHLDQDGDIAGVEILAEYAGGSTHKIDRATRPGRWTRRSAPASRSSRRRGQPARRLATDPKW